MDTSRSSAACAQFVFPLREEQWGCQYWFRQPCSSTGPLQPLPSNCWWATHAHTHTNYESKAPLPQGTDSSQSIMFALHLQVILSGPAKTESAKAAHSLLCKCESAAFEQDSACISVYDRTYDVPAPVVYVERASSWCSNCRDKLQGRVCFIQDWLSGFLSFSSFLPKQM